MRGPVAESWVQSNSGGKCHSEGYGTFTMLDVLRGIAVMPRFSGQTDWVEYPYTVGQHSWNVADLLLRRYGDPVLGLAGLLHDGSEGLMGGDLCKPYKNECPDYERLESKVQGSVYRLAGLPERVPAQVKEIDRLILFDEGHALLSHNTDGWLDKYGPGVEDEIKTAEQPPGETLAQLLGLYERLQLWADPLRTQHQRRTRSGT